METLPAIRTKVILQAPGDNCARSEMSRKDALRCGSDQRASRMPSQESGNV